MEFKNTREYIFKNCVDRLENRRKTLNIPQYHLCPDDPTLVSDFFNNKCNRNNPYLINKRLINSTNQKTKTISGAIPILEFKNEFEVLWGDDKEFKENLPFLFKNIIYDLVSSNSEYRDKVETVLSDHIVYSKYSTLLHIKVKHNIPLLNYFGVYDSAVSPENMHSYLDQAIDYLYSKDNFNILFEESFKEFANKQKDYKFFDKRLEHKYIIPHLIPLLIKYVPKFDSLGLRVKELIENDLIKMIEQINYLHSTNSENSPEFISKRNLINASSSYITELEKISNFCDTYKIHL